MLQCEMDYTQWVMTVRPVKDGAEILYMPLAVQRQIDLAGCLASVKAVALAENLTLQNPDFWPPVYSLGRYDAGGAKALGGWLDKCAQSQPVWGGLLHRRDDATAWLIPVGCSSAREVLTFSFYGDYNVLRPRPAYVEIALSANAHGRYLGLFRSDEVNGFIREVECAANGGNAFDGGIGVDARGEAGLARPLAAA